MTAYYSATYSPDDNKLRLYASSRLDSETYARVKAAGFKWAPKQELFVAPMWTPAREDLCLELAGEIGDEDTSLVDRAEARADRFEDYSEKRAQDSERASAAVEAITSGIPFGQPILIGHHSERHARRDQKRIENGMRKAVDMWKTAQYWEARAAGALAHAEYKELPRVRANRIKTIEADKRKMKRSMDSVLAKRAAWEACNSLVRAQLLANTLSHDHTISNGQDYWSAYELLQDEREARAGTPLITWEQVRDILRTGDPGYLERHQRWLEHYNNRLTYEKAMLAEQGASELLAKKPKSAKAQSPLLNYRAAGGSITTENMYHRGQAMTYPQVDMTKAEYAKIYADYKGTRWSADKSHRFRTAMIAGSKLVSVFLTDLKAVDEPKPVAQVYLTGREAAE